MAIRFGSLSSSGGGVSLDPVANVAVSAVSDAETQVTWDAYVGAQFYAVESSVDGVTYVAEACLASGSTSYNDTGLNEGTEYFYRVRVVTEDGISEGVVDSGFTLPAAPSALVATAAGLDAISLSWVDNSSAETSFEVQRSLDGVGGWTTVLTPAANETSDSDTGLDEATQYFYRIRAVQGGAFSDWSNVSDATTDSPLWVSRTSASDKEWEAVASDGVGLFVAVAADPDVGNIMTSPDGITWTLRTATAFRRRDIAYGAGLFVAVGNDGGTNDKIITSPDGITWTPRTGVAGASFMGITYGNGLFVAVSSANTLVATSPDGITWTGRTAAANISWSGVTYSAVDGLFVAVAQSGTGNRVMTSPDGITWTSRTSAADLNWQAVAHGGGVFVAVALNQGTSTQRIMTSPDGITWTLRTHPAHSSWWTDVKWGNGLFIITGMFGGEAMSSPDGVNWALEPASARNWMGVVYGSHVTRFVAVAASGTADRVMTRDD